MATANYDLGSTGRCWVAAVYDVGGATPGLVRQVVGANPDPYDVTADVYMPGDATPKRYQIPKNTPSFTQTLNPPQRYTFTFDAEGGVANAPRVVLYNTPGQTP